MNYFIIINPNSGKKKSIGVFKKVLIPILNKNNHTYTYQLTTHRNHAKEIILKLNLSNIDAILVLGGDGTMHEVVNGILNRDDDKKIPFTFCNSLILISLILCADPSIKNFGLIE